MSIALLGLAGVALVACGGGGGGGSDDGGGGGGGGGGDEEPEEPLNLQPGQTVAQLETVLPDANSFVLHGTVPLPKGAYLPEDGEIPFAVLDWDGSALETQLETVSRYPASADGADVIEVLALVHKDPGLNAGQRARYSLAVLETPIPVPTADNAAEALADGPNAVAQTVQDLVTNESGLLITARDCFDHVYLSRPFEANGVHDVLKLGAARATVRAWEPLLPVTPQSGSTGTLPQLLGVHAYISASAASNVLLVDLRFTNAGDGHDALDARDDPHGKVYFRSIELAVPNGWNLLQDVADPAQGAPYVFNGQTVFPLVAEQQDGKLHVIASQGQFHRRLALCPIGAETRARSLLDEEGLAFACRGVDAESGDEYWSWWNEHTARYFPQRLRLPSLTHLGLDNVRASLSAETASLETILENGTGLGDWPVALPQLGWAHAYGVQYGGMTGGNEINLSQGCDILEAASPEGYRGLELVHRMQTDRQSNTLYRVDGRCTELEDWLQTNGVQQYVNCYFYMGLIGNSDPFGLKTPPTFQVDAVADAGLAPTYEAQLLAYEPHDMQHLIRYTRCAKSLAWIGNDPLAKDDLAMQAELVRLSYHPYYNSPYQQVQETGLLADVQWVAQHPGIGVDFGRGEGWGVDTVAAVYSLASPSDRARLRPWFDSVANVVSSGQVPCTGYLMAAVYEKFLDGKYRTRQVIEHAIADNAVRGVLASVYEGEDAPRTAMLRDFLAASAQAVISPDTWSSQFHAPWRQTAVGPLDWNDGVYCVGEQPVDGHSADADGYQIWPTFAYGYEVQPDPDLLDHALEMAGGATLVDSLQAAGLSNLHNRAALLALAQELAYGLPLAP